MQDSYLMSIPVLSHLVLHTIHFIFYCLVQGSVLDWDRVIEMLHHEVGDDHFDCVMFAILSTVQLHQDGNLQNLASFSPSLMDHAVLVQHLSPASKHSAMHTLSYVTKF